MYRDDPETEPEDDMTATDNTGGRTNFTIGTETRYIDLAGAISQEIYLVDQERSDRKGLISLKQVDGNRIVRVHHRRLVPIAMHGQAAVIETHDSKHYALCPNDSSPVKVDAGDNSITCPLCLQTFNLYWTGAKPMTSATNPSTAPQAAKAPKPEKAANKTAPKEPKPPKALKEPTKVDIAALAQLANCELWTKKNVKFDHERIDVQAHVLLFTGDNPRKLCFNTYNGALGKKTPQLPVDQFLANDSKEVKTPWFMVLDMDKERKKLSSDYEQAK